MITKYNGSLEKDHIANSLFLCVRSVRYMTEQLVTIVSSLNETETFCEPAHKFNSFDCESPCYCSGRKSNLNCECSCSPSTDCTYFNTSSSFIPSDENSSVNTARCMQNKYKNCIIFECSEKCDSLDNEPNSSRSSKTSTKDTKSGSQLSSRPSSRPSSRKKKHKRHHDSHSSKSEGSNTSKSTKSNQTKTASYEDVQDAIQLSSSPKKSIPDDNKNDKGSITDLIQEIIKQSKDTEDNLLKSFLSSVENQQVSMSSGTSNHLNMNSILETVLNTLKSEGQRNSSKVKSILANSKSNYSNELSDDTEVTSVFQKIVDYLRSDSAISGKNIKSLLSQNKTSQPMYQLNDGTVIRTLSDYFNQQAKRESENERYSQGMEAESSLKDLFEQLSDIIKKVNQDSIASNSTIPKQAQTDTFFNSNEGNEIINKNVSQKSLKESFRSSNTNKNIQLSEALQELSDDIRGSSNVNRGNPVGSFLLSNKGSDLINKLTGIMKDVKSEKSHQSTSGLSQNSKLTENIQLAETLQEMSDHIQDAIRNSTQINKTDPDKSFLDSPKESDLLHRLSDIVKDVKSENSNLPKYGLSQNTKLTENIQLAETLQEMSDHIQDTIRNSTQINKMDSPKESDLLHKLSDIVKEVKSENSNPPKSDNSKINENSQLSKVIKRISDQIQDDIRKSTQISNKTDQDNPNLDNPKNSDMLLKLSDIIKEAKSEKSNQPQTHPSQNSRSSKIIENIQFAETLQDMTDHIQDDVRNSIQVNNEIDPVNPFLSGPKNSDMLHRLSNIVKEVKSEDINLPKTGPSQDSKMNENIQLSETIKEMSDHIQDNIKNSTQISNKSDPVKSFLDSSKGSNLLHRLSDIVKVTLEDNNPPQSGPSQDSKVNENIQLSEAIKEMSDHIQDEVKNSTQISNKDDQVNPFLDSVKGSDLLHRLSDIVKEVKLENTNQPQTGQSQNSKVNETTQLSEAINEIPDHVQDDIRNSIKISKTDPVKSYLDSPKESDLLHRLSDIAKEVKSENSNPSKFGPSQNSKINENIQLSEALQELSDHIQDTIRNSSKISKPDLANSFLSSHKGSDLLHRLSDIVKEVNSHNSKINENIQLSEPIKEISDHIHAEVQNSTQISTQTDPVKPLLSNKDGDPFHKMSGNIVHEVKSDYNNDQLHSGPSQQNNQSREFNSSRHFNQNANINDYSFLPKLSFFTKSNPVDEPSVWSSECIVLDGSNMAIENNFLYNSDFSSQCDVQQKSDVKKSIQGMYSTYGSDDEELSFYNHLDVENEYDLTSISNGSSDTSIEREVNSFSIYQSDFVVSNNDIQFPYNSDDNGISSISSNSDSGLDGQNSVDSSSLSAFEQSVLINSEEIFSIESSSDSTQCTDSLPQNVQQSFQSDFNNSSSNVHFFKIPNTINKPLIFSADSSINIEIFVDNLNDNTNNQCKSNSITNCLTSTTKLEKENNSLLNVFEIKTSSKDNLNYTNSIKGNDDTDVYVDIIQIENDFNNNKSLFKRKENVEMDNSLYNATMNEVDCNDRHEIQFDIDSNISQLNNEECLLSCYDYVVSWKHRKRNTEMISSNRQKLTDSTITDSLDGIDDENSEVKSYKRRKKKKVEVIEPKKLSKSKYVIECTVENFCT